MQRVEVDGVPVFWAQGPEPLTGGLFFGVGRRDETFVGGGITHLVEHLAMHALGRTTLDCNASVDLLATEFTAAGRPDRLVDFFRRICEILADLPLDRLGVEASVLRAEGGGACHPALAHLLADRYGGRGVGLAAFDEPALLSIAPDHVRDWAARWFTRRNAALWLSGPPPAGLALPLPDGPAPPPRPRPVRRVTTPAWSPYPFREVALTLEVPRSVAIQSALRVARDRLEDDLRHGRGLSYDVALDTTWIDADTSHVALLADVRDQQAPDAWRALWRAVRDVATDGPTDAELAHDKEGSAEFLDDPRSAPDYAQALAVAHLIGREVTRPDLLREQMAALTAGDVRDGMAAVLGTALLGVPEGVEVDLPGFARVERDSPPVTSGREFRRRLGSRAPRGARLVLGADGVALDLGRDGRHAVRWEDVMGLVDEGDGSYSLVGAHGAVLPLSAADWWHGGEVIAAVRAAVPADLQVRQDPPIGDPGPA